MDYVFVPSADRANETKFDIINAYLFADNQLCPS